MHADKGVVTRIKRRPLCRHAINRIWAIEHEDPDIMFLADAHTEVHRPDKGVIARADVLKIDKEQINVLQHF